MADIAAHRQHFIGCQIDYTIETLTSGFVDPDSRRFEAVHML